jgi:hypothetical protein
LKPIARISRICSEGIEASDNLLEMVPFLVNGLGTLLRHEAAQPKNPGSLCALCASISGAASPADACTDT